MVHISKFHLTEHLFRTKFELKNKSVLRWFPGHMGKGIKQMQQKLKSVDCIIEVHDARIPFSGRNPKVFQTITGLRPHVLVYNKKDLANEQLQNSIIDKHKANGFENVIFTNCKDTKCSGIKNLIPTVQKLILSSCRYNRSENLDYCLMVVGIPNVGKSTIINVLRNKYLLRGNAVHVGAAPGITRNVGEKIKISDEPLIYVLDTPGILTPTVPSIDDGFKLALCATIPDKEVGIELVADYLLFWLNKNRNFQYIDFFGVDKVSDNITELLAAYAVHKNLMVRGVNVEGKHVSRPNLYFAACHFVEGFRSGLFGQITLDLDKLNIPNKKSYIMQKKLGSNVIH